MGKFLTDIFDLLHHTLLPIDRIGQQKSVVLQPGQKRGRHSHLVLKTQVMPRRLLLQVQQIAASLHDTVQQLHHSRFPLSLVGKRLNIICHFLRHNLNDFGCHQHITAVQRFATCYLHKKNLRFLTKPFRGFFP